MILLPWFVFSCYQYILYMNPYIASALGSILTGIHIFSIKYVYLFSLPNTYFFYLLIAISLTIWTLSRVFIYIACEKLSIPSIHIIMNLSILVSTLCSILLLNTKVHYLIFLLGVLFMLCGVYCVNLSVKYSNNI